MGRKAWLAGVGERAYIEEERVRIAFQIQEVADEPKVEHVIDTCEM